MYWRRGALWFHELQVWPILTLGFSGFTFKSYEFSCFELCHRLRVWPFVTLGFPVFHSKLLFYRVFEVAQSM